MQIDATSPVSADIGQLDQAKSLKLADSAKQFEAMLIQQMLKPLQFGGAPGDDEEATGGAGDTIRTMGTEALSNAIAKGGGFGLADRIVHQVTAENERNERKQHTTKV